MPNAIITKSTLSSGFTQAQLVTALTNSLNNCGFSSGTFVAQGTSGPIIKTVYSHQFNTNTKGTVFLDYGANSNTNISLNISDNYNTAALTSTTPSSSINFTVTNSSNYDFYAVAHPEIRGVCVNGLNSTNHTFLGYIRPANKPSWWNENLFLYCASQSINLSSSTFCGPNPYSGSSRSCGITPIDIGSNNGELTTDLILAPLFIANSRGVAGQMSTDYGLSRTINLSGTSLVPGDKLIVTPGVQEYFVICSTSSNSQVIRIV